MSAPRLCSYTLADRDDQLLDVYDDGSVRWDESGSALHASPVCVWCNGVLRRDKSGSHPIEACDDCGWWRFSYATRSFLVAEQHFVAGKAQEFEIRALDVPLEDLRRFLRRRPAYVVHTHPTRFEQLVGSCLRVAYPGSEVQHVGGSHDRGIDLLLVTTDAGTYLVQVKRRTNIEGHEGVQVVRELNGVLFREGQAKGMVITTAAAFTPAARDEARVATVTRVPYEMVLLSYPDVVRLLQLPSPEPYAPWRQFLPTPGGP